MTRDEFLTKAMGLKWQEWSDDFMLRNNVSRDVLDKNNNPDFGDSYYFVELLLWSQDDNRTYVPQGGPEKWTWERFMIQAFYCFKKEEKSSKIQEFTRWLFNPERFAGILAEYLGWREEK